MPAPIPKKISQILPTFQNVAQTSNYLVKFALPPHTNSDGYSLGNHLRSKGVDFRFVGDEIGMLCSNASLPGSAMASVDVVGNYQGVVERFAHTRNFTQISLEFYVDNKYKTLKFLEHWMEYIAGANPNAASEEGYHFKMRYPDLYKSNETRIIKFERNYRQFLEYKFVGLFPLSLNSTRIGYQNSQVLKATCNFSYDRYICGQTTSASQDAGLAENNDPNNGYVWHSRNSDYIQDKIGNTSILNSPTGQTSTVNTVKSDGDGLREWTTDQPINGPWKYFAN